MIEAFILLFVFILPTVIFIIYLIGISRPGATEFKFSNFVEAIIEHFFHNVTGSNVAPFINNHSKRLTEAELKLLRENIFYYQALVPKAKRIFENRVVNFMHSIEISGRQDFEVTRDMELLISATAVQLTFGWRKYYLSMFKRIFVFPTAYYNRFTKNYHKGETSPQGVVVLSWDSFEKGHSITDDNLNLGIHEFAHALIIQRNKSPEYSDPIFMRWVDKLSKMLENPRVFKILSEHAYFREYARANEMEFFAVATEAFFETPGEFKNALPNLYELMCKMYNQNPLRLYQSSSL